MFKKNDPLIDSVKNVMKENSIRRDVEKMFNESLGIQSKKVLPHEYHAQYDAALKECIDQALAEKVQMSKSDIAKIGKKIDPDNNPNKVDPTDLSALRKGLHKEEQINELKAETLKSYVKKAEKQLFQGKVKNPHKEYERQLGVDRAEERLNTGKFGQRRMDMKLDPENPNQQKIVTFVRKYKFKEDADSLEEKRMFKPDKSLAQFDGVPKPKTLKPSTKDYVNNGKPKHDVKNVGHEYPAKPKVGKYGGPTELEERKLSDKEKKKKEDLVMSMKKNLPGFKKRYGKRAENVLYGTATKMAKKDE